MFWEKSYNFEKNKKKLQVDFWESYYVLCHEHVCQVTYIENGEYFDSLLNR